MPKCDKRYVKTCKLSAKNDDKMRSTFPETEGIPGPTGQNEKWHYEEGRAALAAAFDFDEASDLNFSLLACAFKRTRLSC